MVSARLRCLVVLPLLAAAVARAEPERTVAPGELQRNGAVSRHLWVPGDAVVELAGRPLSAGVAIGLRDGLRSNLGVAIAPALNLRLGERSTLSLLAGGNGAVMLVLQARP